VTGYHPYDKSVQNSISQPATKIVEHLESKLAEAHCAGDTTVSDLQKFWDEKGQEPLSFDFNDATPDLLYYLHLSDATS
jgi:hypothetical protein